MSSISENGEIVHRNDNTDEDESATFSDSPDMFDASDNQEKTSKLRSKAISYP